MCLLFLFLSPLECSIWIMRWELSALSSVNACGRSESQTGCHHFVWRKQHSDTSEKSGGMLLVSGETFSWQNEDTVKMHARAHTDKQDGRQFVQADRLGDKTYPHTHDNSRQDCRVQAAFSRLSVFLIPFAMTGPNGRVVWRTGERDAVNVCVHESGKCMCVKKNGQFDNSIIFYDA